MENDNHEIYGNPRNTGRRGLQVEAKPNHCYGHTPQIQKGAKTSNSGVERMPFVTVRQSLICNFYLSVEARTSGHICS